MILDAIKNVYLGKKGHNHLHKKRQSAVLIPLVEHQGSLSLLYEVRSLKLTHQPGEVCFPGGRMEEGEDPLMTSRRETCEELFVKEEDIEIIGEMDAFEMGNGQVIWPVVGVIHNEKGTYSKDEVDHLFYVPIKWLFANAPAHYKLTTTTTPEENFPVELIPGGKDYAWPQVVREVSLYMFDHEVIWGVTANITSRFIQSIKPY
jgi:8-oxo-dGTP pyrophosphatase MutT (NUDIX family)